MAGLNRRKIIPLSLALVLMGVLLWFFNPMTAGHKVRGFAELPPIPSRVHTESPGGFYLPPTGLCDDYPIETVTDEKILRDLKTVKETGAHYFRFGIGWDDFEPAYGVYEWGFLDKLVRMARKENIALLPYIAYTPEWAANVPDDDRYRRPPEDPQWFADFMYQLVSRYKADIHSWELWTEPDLENYWMGITDEFYELAKAGALAVKRADPSAKVVFAGLADARSEFFQELLENTDILKYYDVVNLHGYFETWQENRAESYPDYLSEVYNSVKDRFGVRDLWLAEFGYSDYRKTQSYVADGVRALYDYEHTRAYQAVALWKHHVLAVASEVLSLSAWFRVNDLVDNENVIGDGNNRHLGVLDAEGKPKPAYYAFKFFNQVFDRPYRVANEAMELELWEHSSAVVYAFEFEDGKLAIVGWLRSSWYDEVDPLDGTAKDQRRESISVSFKDRELRGLKVYNELGEELKASSAKLSGRSIQGIELSGDKIFIGLVDAEKPRKSYTMN